MRTWRKIIQPRCVGWLLGVLAANAAIASERPNILFIVSDDQVHSALGIAGDTRLQTPNLDRLAREGLRFTHAFVPLPICTPSRAAFLTGRFGSSNGVQFFGDKIHENIVTWPQTMARNGYQTAMTGKWHNVRDGDYYGFEWTGNVFIAGMGPFTDQPMIQKFGEKPQLVKGNTTELYTDTALRFLDERDRDRPFFLYVAHQAPHDPRVPVPHYTDLYDPALMPLPPNFRPVPKFDPGTLDIRDERLLPIPRPIPKLKLEIARYFGLISHLDAQIGRLLRGLEEKGLADNTIVIFCGDNGLTLGAHGFLGKQTLHEEGIRIPLIIRHPRLRGQAGQTRDALVYLHDLMPTVCEWTGTPLPEGVQGKSLVTVSEGTQPGVRDAVFGRYNERKVPLMRMIRTHRYKLIKYFKAEREELFDLENDPYEMNDLSGDPDLQQVCNELRRRLIDWLVEQDDRIALDALER